MAGRRRGHWVLYWSFGMTPSGKLKNSSSTLERVAHKKSGQVKLLHYGWERGYCTKYIAASVHFCLCKCHTSKSKMVTPPPSLPSNCPLLSMSAYSMTPSPHVKSCILMKKSELNISVHLGFFVHKDVLACYNFKHICVRKEPNNDINEWFEDVSPIFSMMFWNVGLKDDRKANNSKWRLIYIPYKHPLKRIFI